MTSNRVVALTGGTGLIGKIVARDIARAGYAIALLGRSQARLDDLAAGLREDTPGVTIHTFVVDLSEKQAGIRVAERMIEAGVKPYGVLHCARDLGYFRHDQDEIVSLEHWIGEFTVDVVVPCEISQTLARISNGALRSVVIVSSMYGVTPPKPMLYERPGDIPPINYGVCKAAQLHLTEELSVRLAPKGVRVNAISYGGVRGRVNPAFEARYAMQCPAHRMLDEADLSGPILFLLSDASSATTGHNLLAEGGWTIW